MEPAAGTAPENAPLGPAWRCALAATVGLAVGPSVILVMAYGVFLPALRQEFGWSLTEAAAGSALISIAIVLSSPLQGMLSDRLGARRLVLATSPLFAAGVMALAGLNGSRGLFYLACATLPFLGLGLWPVTYSRAVAGWFDRKLGLAMGVVAAGVGIGGMIMPPIVAYLLQEYGWRVAYLSAGAISLLATFPAALAFLREPPRAAAEHAVVQTTGDTLPEALRTRAFQRVLTVFLLLGVVSSAVLVHQPSLLLEQGLPLKQVGLIQGAVGAAVIVGRLGVGWLLDRLPIAAIMPPLLIGAAGACALYALGFGAAVAPFAAVVLGLVIGAEIDVLGYVVRRRHGMKAFGALYGVVFAVFSLGSAAGAIVVGVLHGRFGGYDAPFWALAAILVLSAWLFLTMGAKGEGTRAAARP